MLSLQKKNLSLLQTSPFLFTFLFLLPFIALPLTKLTNTIFPLQVDQNQIEYLDNTPSIFNLSVLPNKTTEQKYLINSFTNKTLGLLFTDQRLDPSESETLSLSELQTKFIEFIQSEDFGICMNTSTTHDAALNNNCTLLVFETELIYILNSSQGKVVNELVDIGYSNSSEISFNLYSRLFPLYGKDNQLSNLYNIPILQEMDYINAFNVYFMKFLKWKENAIEDTTDNKEYESLYIHPMNVSKYVRFTDNHTNIYPYPVSCMTYISSAFLGLGFSFIGLFYIFSSVIIEEKQYRIKDLLRFQGISTFQYVLSWYITYIVTMIAPLALFIMLFIFLWLKAQMYTILALMFVLFMNSLNVISFSFLGAMFITEKHTSKWGVYAVYSLVMLFYFLFTYFEEYDAWLKRLFYLFPNVNLALSFEFIFLGTNYQHGMNSEVSNRMYKDTTFRKLMIMNMSVWAAVTFVVGVKEYITNKNRREKKSKAPSDRESDLVSLRTHTSFVPSEAHDHYGEVDNSNQLMSGVTLVGQRSGSFKRSFEKVTEDKLRHQLETKKCLMVQNVCKSFREFKAVKNFSCNFFKGQIFVLLGENGAGKSTLLNMISGRCNVDSGNITLSGKDIVNNKHYLYSNLGLCLQDDIYFEELTIKQQLELICRIKLSLKERHSRGDSTQYKEEAETLIHGLGLREFVHKKGKELSGGNLRKLCVAFALISNSELVILDEPTSGMDLKEKKMFWDFLKTVKSERIIIITTHSMEEAEYLGDVIGIMSEGELISKGSSSFLKQTYPCGFNVNLILSGTKVNIKQKAEMIYSIRLIEPKMQIKVFGKDLIKINFPDSSLKASGLEGLFRLIELFIVEEKISNYTVSTTSLEDVFFQVNDSEFTKNIFEKELSDLIRQVEAEYKYHKKDQQIKELLQEDADSFMQYSQDDIIKYTDNNNDNKQQQELETIMDINKDGNNEGDDNEQDKLRLSLLLNTDSLGESAVLVQSVMKRHLKRLWLTSKRRYFMLLFQVFISAIFLIYIIVLKPITIIKFFYFYFIREFYPKDQLYQYQIIDKSSSQAPRTIEDFSFAYALEFRENKVIDPSSEESDYISIVEQYNFDPVKDFIFINYTDTHIEMHNFFTLSSPTINYMLVNNILQKHLSKRGIKASLLNGYTLSPQKFRRIDVQKLAYNYIIISLLVISQLISCSFAIDTPLQDEFKEIKTLISLSMKDNSKYWLSLFVVDYIKYIFITILGYCIITFVLPEIWVMFPLSLMSGVNFILMSYLFVSLFGSARYITAAYLMINAALIIFTLLINEYSRIEIKKYLNLTLFDIWPVTSTTQFLFDIRESQLITEDSAEYRAIKLMLGVGIGVAHCGILLFVFWLSESGLLKKWFKRVRQCASSSKYIDSNKIEENIRQENLLSISDGADNSTLTKTLNEETVVTERQRIMNNKELFTFFIENLSVTYTKVCGKDTKAVDKLYLGLEQKGKFALMGHSGAGKTSTIKSILNKVPINQGNVTLDGVDLLQDSSTMQNKIGYCPQINSLFDYLTVKETFEFYDKGVVSSLVSEGVSAADSFEERVTRLLVVFGLHKYQNSLTMNLSGGNKRKLLFAIALMNNPELILLDEPSTGVDPDSRRLMWKNVVALQRHKEKSKNKFNLLVATQSLEEAEVLCDNLGWMEKGKFVYIGNSESLKLKLSAGYYLKIKFKKPVEEESEMLIENLKYNELQNLKKMENFKTDINELKTFDNWNNIEKAIYFLYLDSFLEVITQENTKVKFLDYLENQVLLILNFDKKRKAYIFSNLLTISGVQTNINEVSISIQPFDTFIDEINN